MQTLSRLVLDLQRKTQPQVSAVQGEANTRTLLVSLYENGAAWDIPADVTVEVAFKKPDGTQGIYSKLPSGSPATSFEGNVVTVTLAPQVLTCAGKVIATFILSKNGGKTLASFPFIINVAENPGAGAEVSEDYYNPTIGDFAAELKAIMNGISTEVESAVKGAVKNLTAKDVGAVPATDFIDWFGLPTSIPANADVNTYTTTGKYYCTEANSKTLANSPVGSDAFVMYVFARSSKSVAQLVFCYAGLMLYRMTNSSGDFAKDWTTFLRKGQALLATESTSYPGCFYRTVDDVTEWYNPPMTNGKEYRTTERSNGAIVYVKRIAYTFTTDIGDGSTNVDYSVPHNISSFVRLVRIFATDGVSYPLPYYTSAGGYIVFKSVDASDVHLRAYKASMSARPLYFDVYYTKE